MDRCVGCALLAAGLVVTSCASWGTTRKRDGGSSGSDAVMPDGWIGPEAGVDAAPIPDGGYPCNPDPPPGGDQCANAIDLGDLSDVQADAVTVTGNAVPAGREIWWRFRATDDADTAGDEFHVDVRFLINGGDAYEFDIYRTSCSAADRLCAGTFGPFDWYTDQNYTSTGCSGPSPCGEGDCSSLPDQENVNHCSDDTAVFYVVVRRSDGALSCDGFTLELSNGLYASP